MYPFLRPILNKGGAGRSLSRKDTIEALNPLIEHHGRLLATYNAAILNLGDRQLAQQVETLLNRHRTELAKLRETVLALGGIPPSGIGLRNEEIHLGTNDGEILYQLEQRERDYRSALKETLDYPHHQIRTNAILANNITGSDERIGSLRPLVDRTPRRDKAAQPAPVNEATDEPADIDHTTQTAAHGEQPAALRAERADERAERETRP